VAGAVPEPGLMLTVPDAQAKARVAAARAIMRLVLPEARILPLSEPPRPDPDGRVVMNGVDWWQYETMLAVRGDRAGVRMTYLDGALEIMSPSRTHEMVKKSLARLLEAYADERGIVLQGFGSLTMKDPAVRRGIEPDECYNVGSVKETPDLALEVIWTHGGLDKLDIYARLGVREVWLWQDDRLTVYVLRDGRYEQVRRGDCFPDLDPGWLNGFLAHETQTAGVRALREALRV